MHSRRIAETVIDGCRPFIAPHFNLTVELPLKAIVRGYSWTMMPITWRNRRTGEAKLKLKEMGSRYLFIILYVWLEKYFSRGDYRRPEVDTQVIAKLQRPIPLSTPPGRQKTNQRLVSLMVLLCLIYMAVAATDRASQRFFWTDEVVTVVIARLPSVSAIWSAISRMAPMASRQLFLSWTRHCRIIDTDPHLAYRLPSIIGYLLTLAALFVFVARTAGPIGGGVAMAMACLTPLFSVYAIEARPTAFVMACLSWALVVWQRIDRPWRAPMLALLLGSASALHYFAILGVVPFALAGRSPRCGGRAGYAPESGWRSSHRPSRLRLPGR